MLIERQLNLNIFKHLRMALLGMPYAIGIGMKLTPPILKELSRQITHGNPCWGLVVANEYLAAGSPLRLALVTQFLRRLENHQNKSSLVERLIAGARSNELPAELALEIGSRHIFTTRYLNPHRAPLTEAQRRRSCSGRVKARINRSALRRPDGFVAQRRFSQTPLVAGDASAAQSSYGAPRVRLINARKTS